MLGKIQVLKEKIDSGERFLWRVIAKNESRSSASHQMGIYIDKHFWNVCFEERPARNSNLHRIISVEWFDGRSSSQARVVYYGKGRKDEYRITRLNRNFDIGTTLVLVKLSKENYFGCELSGEVELGAFFKMRQQMHDAQPGV